MSTVDACHLQFVLTTQQTALIVMEFLSSVELELPTAVLYVLQVYSTYNTGRSECIFVNLEILNDATFLKILFIPQLMQVEDHRSRWRTSAAWRWAPAGPRAQCHRDFWADGTAPLQ